MPIRKKPWYREPFVWLLILFPASAVIGGLFTIYLAIASNDGLVVDDYYKQGLEINRTLARHGLEATLHFERHRLHLSLNANSDYKLPHQIVIHFNHHTRSGFDKTVPLERISDNGYQASLPDLIVGTWTVQLTGDDWRLLKSVRLPMTKKESKIYLGRPKL
ncbi:hypothetical protein PN36_16135 [Candidatus Thiomargarita nelsonii]|uniref:FixH family protein n=1 Tax=Candidatus Thiomargarita nelsonii TaxID=1003181 RepID=A0A4E0QPM0_9GAMM|nr:hypothetical protein PN36_16135 [Candidatus Thiomargarita nelsonii]